MTVLAWLVLAHILADFYGRTSRWEESSGLTRGAESKVYVSSAFWAALMTRLLRLYRPTLIYAVAILAALLLAVSLNQLSLSWNLVWAWLAIAAGHAVIHVVQSYMRPTAWALILDQLAHLAVLVLVWGWLTGLFPFVSIWTRGFLLQRDHLIFASAYLLAAKPVSMFVAAALSRQAQALAQQGQGLVEAGRMIGYVERWLIMSFVLSGHFIGVGFLLAAKSIFRFGDLSQAHERRLTEYMLLGTLLSFISALALAGLARFLTG